MEKSYVTAGKPNVSGAVWVGPLTATLPTSVDATLTGFTELGYVSEDGLTNTNGLESADIKDWGGTTVLTTQTGKSDEFKFKLLEVLNPEVLKVIYGSDNVTVNGSTIKVEANADPLDDYAWIFDIMLRDGSLKRIVIPCGTIKELGDIGYVGSDATGFDITLSATPDADGNTHIEYIYLATGVTGATGATGSTGA